MRDFLPGCKILEHRGVLVELGMRKGQAAPGLLIVGVGRDCALQNGNGSGELLGVDQALAVAGQQAGIFGAPCTASASSGAALSGAPLRR